MAIKYDALFKFVRPNPALSEEEKELFIAGPHLIHETTEATIRKCQNSLDPKNFYLKKENIQGS
jgi:hypothetical protein